MSATIIQFEMPFVVFLGDTADAIYAKTGLGMVHWRPEECAGQMRLPGCGVNANVPDLSIVDAKKAGVRSLIIGSAAVGGGVPAHWVATLGRRQCRHRHRRGTTRTFSKPPRTCGSGGSGFRAPSRRAHTPGRPTRRYGKKALR